MPMRYLMPFLLFIFTAPLLAQGHDRCGSCHREGTGGDKESVGALRQPLPRLCIECHKERLGRGEHPIDITPLTALPTSLPLLDGMVSCTTCHDPHGQQPMQLRVESNLLCQDCHRK